MSAPGTLYVVATPIGNLGDLTPRARDTLAAAAVIAAEDTRHTGRLLAQFGIERPLLSLHEHNEAARAAQIVARLRAGDAVALVSDAGTPLISDPGFRLVAEVRAAGLRVVPLPGACAAIAALSVAGLPTDRFCFEGFLPQRAAARRARLAALAHEPRTLVCYEAPHRLAETLADLRDAFGAGRRAVIGRELTKLHETVYDDTLAALASLAGSDANLARGEAVLVIAGAAAAEEGADAADGALTTLLRALLPELPLARAVAVAVAVTGARRNHVYQRALALQSDAGGAAAAPAGGAAPPPAGAADGEDAER